MLLLLLIILFVIYSIIINTNPTISLWDWELIEHTQAFLSNVSPAIPVALGGILYSIMIIIPLIVAGIYFFNKRKVFDVEYLALVPLITYGISLIIKLIVARPRPPIELQLSVHSDGYSFVSNHTIVTSCLWGMIIYYVINYCDNKFLKHSIITFSAVWMIIMGFSRIWLGVHNPTDVFAAYFLGGILLIIYIRIREFIAKYIGL